MGDSRSRTGDDERLLARAEEALTQIKVASGLSEPHEAVLAALRIRLKGDAGKSLDELLAAADDPEEHTQPASTGDQARPRTLDDLMSAPEKPKRTLDDLLG